MNFDPDVQDAKRKFPHDFHDRLTFYLTQTHPARYHKHRINGLNFLHQLDVDLRINGLNFLHQPDVDLRINGLNFLHQLDVDLRL